MTTTPHARQQILTRIRHTTNTNTDTDTAETAAAADTATTTATETAAAAAAAIERGYLPTHTPESADLAALLAENLTDYRAHLHHTTTTDLPALITRLLTRHTRHTRARLVIPDAIPTTWIPPGIDPLTDTPPLTPAQLDTADAVITTTTLAIAETGTLILDAGPGQGRRILSLIPDHHICIIPTHTHIVASLPHAIPHLDPTRPQTWISGPSATSDIELDRIEGVHGPRHLDVILIEEINEERSTKKAAA